MPIVNYQGQRFSFPDDWDNEKMSTALQMWRDGQPVPAATTTSSLTKEDEVILNEQHERPDTGGLGFESELVGLNEQQEQFRSTIQRIETGGLDSEWIRTKVAGSQSTAYGTYQITRGLINGFLDTKRDLFTETEQGAMEELSKRQSVAIAVGGKDRAKYESGGSSHAQAKSWAKEFGYATVKDMLDAFDYGGDYGLAEDTDWQFQYENFSRKMLNAHLKDANGDALEAASVWHGGTGWKKGKHRKQTDVYRRKYETYTKGDANAGE